MKKYKVICKANEKSSTFAVYKDNKKEAENFANDYTGISAEIKVVNVEYHHQASKKGYIRKGCGYNEYYNGKFGEGYIEHLSNTEGSPNGSNNYHYVRYYIEKSN